MYPRILVPLGGSKTAEKMLPMVEGQGLCHVVKDKTTMPVLLVTT